MEQMNAPLLLWLRRTCVSMAEAKLSDVIQFVQDPQLLNRRGPLSAADSRR